MHSSSKLPARHIRSLSLHLLAAAFASNSFLQTFSFTLFVIALCFLTVASGKSDSMGETSCKCHVIDLETKMKIICRHEGGQTIIFTAHELHYAPSIAIQSLSKISLLISLSEHANGTPTMKEQ